jgi:hypothetical protein
LVQGVQLNQLHAFSYFPAGKNKKEKKMKKKEETEEENILL